MKITVTLSENQVNGITQYLKAVDELENVLKSDIQAEINAIVQSVLQDPHMAISDYIKNN